MTIENKPLYNLFKSLFKTGKIDLMCHGRDGMYLEGFNGGITAYVTDNKACYCKTFYGDNKDVFVYYFDAWQKKDGYTDLKEFEADYYKPIVSDYNKSVFTEMKALFKNERFNKIIVDYNEFKQAVKGVDAINKGDKTRNIVLSIHNGKFDMASWNYAGSATWQLDGDYPGNGAFMISKRYLDGVKADKTLKLSYGEVNGETALYISGDVDAVIMQLPVEPTEFLEVLEYEYETPKKMFVEKPVPLYAPPTLSEILEAEREHPQKSAYIDHEKELAKVLGKPVMEKPQRKRQKPRIKRENGAFTGWTYNKLGTRQTKVCNW